MTKPKNKSMPRSIYCWSNIDTVKSGMELHFNIWIRKIPFLDIGIMIPKSINRIYISLPGKIVESDMKSINYLLCKSKILNAVFNDYMTMNTNGHPGEYSEIKNESGSKQFGLLNDIKFKREVHGENTLIIIDVPTCPFPSAYFRIRISGKSVNELYNTKQPTFGILQDTKTVTSILDFRVNDARTKPDSIDKKRMIEKTKISVCHLLLMLPTTEDIQMSSNSYMSRLLEKEEWKEYLEDSLSSSDVVAYHWKIESSDNNKHIAILCKIAKIKWDLLRVIGYLFIAFGVGVDASMLAYLIILILIGK